MCCSVCAIYMYIQCIYIYMYMYIVYDIVGGTRWGSWLRHCATSRRVAGSIPDGVTGIFH